MNRVLLALSIIFSVVVARQVQVEPEPVLEDEVELPSLMKSAPIFMQNIYKELAVAMEDYTGLEVNGNLRSFNDYVDDTVKSIREQINERVKNRTDQMQAFANKLKSRRSKKKQEL